MSAAEGSRRAIILAVAAVGLTGLAAYDQLSGSGGSADLSVAPPSPRGAPAAEPPPAGAPPDAGLEALRTRYRPIVTVRPFATRSFEPKPQAAGTPRPREPRPEVRATPPPATFKVRFTALLGQGAERVAVLEERGTGKGLLAKAGRTIGDTSIASVDTNSVTVVTAGETTRLAFGESLNLPLALRLKLDSLRADAVKTETKPVVTSSGVEISEEKRQSILERLRARRRKTVKGDK